MKNGTARLPSRPTRIYQSLFHRRKPEEVEDDPNSQNLTTTSPNEEKTTPVSESSPPPMSAWERRLPRFLQPSVNKRRQRIRRLSLCGVVFFIITVILLSTILTQTSRASYGSFFMKPCNVSLSQGIYRGQVLDANAQYPRSLQVYRGIPYAQSTTGQNRFRPPQKLTTTNETGHVTDALTFGLDCPQPGTRSSGSGENCLVANIYRPHFGDTRQEIDDNLSKLGLNESSKLPVVVYIPGGAFNTGSGSERNLASLAAWSDTPIVAVSFNYRLGAFGFLPSAVTAKEGVLNLGLKDQQFLLEWLRENIPAFWGDPDNVTLTGQSAGAHSVGHHIISYSPANTLVSAPPPFQKAILESGATTARAVFVPDHHLYEQQFRDFIEQCGLQNVPDDELFGNLRKLSYSKIHAASTSVWDKYDSSLQWAFQPCIDGEGGVIPDLPIESWKKGNALRIPIMTGFNTNEGATFVPEDDNDPNAVRDFMSTLIPALNKTSLDIISDKLYPNISTTTGMKLYVNKYHASKYGSQFWPLQDAYGTYAYKMPILQTAHYAASAPDAAPVYVYHFAARSAAFGAADHGDESKYVVHDMVALDAYQGLNATANVMTGAWSRFIATGDPNPSSTLLPVSASDPSTQFTWPQYVSPFTSSGAANTASNAGVVALFGAGNDEAMGSSGTHSMGVPAQTERLDQRYRDEMLFWWPRVVYSEGYGNGSLSIAPETTKT